jgi:hypothetical protein
MVRNQKTHIDANPAVACIRRARPWEVEGRAECATRARDCFLNCFSTASSH